MHTNHAHNSMTLTMHIHGCRDTGQVSLKSYIVITCSHHVMQDSTSCTMTVVSYVFVGPLIKLNCKIVFSLVAHRCKGSSDMCHINAKEMSQTNEQHPRKKRWDILAFVLICGVCLRFSVSVSISHPTTPTSGIPSGQLHWKQLPVCLAFCIQDASKPLRTPTALSPLGCCDPNGPATQTSVSIVIHVSPD